MSGTKYRSEKSNDEQGWEQKRKKSYVYEQKKKKKKHRTTTTTTTLLTVGEMRFPVVLLRVITISRRMDGRTAKPLAGVILTPQRRVELVKVIV